MQSFILNFWHHLIRQSWRYEIFILLTQLQHWSKIDRLLSLGTHGAGFLHDIGNTTMVIRFLHADFAHQLTNRQNREFTAQLELLSQQIIQGQNVLSQQDLLSHSFNVYECLTECIHLFQNHPLGKSCTVKILGNKNINLFGPSAVFTQAVINILNNSAQALQHQKIKRITIEVSKKKYYFCIRICDSGPGFPKNFKVQPFYTTKSDGNGIGLWHSLLQLKKHFCCTSKWSNHPRGGAQTQLYFWQLQ